MGFAAATPSDSAGASATGVIVDPGPLAVSTGGSATPARHTAGDPVGDPTATPRALLPGHLFGLTSDGPGQGIASAQTTSAHLGRHLDIVNFYQAWVWNKPLPTAELAQIASGGAIPEITWEPWDPRLGTNQPAFALSRIASGAYDTYITSWARSAAGYNKPVLIRFAHEMNGNWYPWSVGVNGGTAKTYIAAYRHVHDLFDAAGARNVSWVWSPNVIQNMPSDTALAYPGATYADLIGIDGYNGGSDIPSMGGWRTPQQLFAPTLAMLARRAPRKPVIINETGSTENGGDKATWIGQLFDYAKTTRVVGVVWFDYNTIRADWRLAASPESRTTAQVALRNW